MPVIRKANCTFVSCSVIEVGTVVAFRSFKDKLVVVRLLAAELPPGESSAKEDLTVDARDKYIEKVT